MFLLIYQKPIRTIFSQEQDTADDFQSNCISSQNLQILLDFALTGISNILDHKPNPWCKTELGDCKK